VSAILGHTLDQPAEFVYDGCMRSLTYRLIAACTFLAAAVVRADPPEARAKLEHDGPVMCLAFSPDGKLLAAGDKDSTVRLWKVASGKLAHKLTSRFGEVLFVAFAPGGKLLASSSTDGIVRVWDPASGRQVVQRETFMAVNRIAFVNDEGLAILHKENFSLFDAASLKETRKFEVPAPVRWLGATPGGRAIATLTVNHVRVGDAVTVDGSLRVLDVLTGKEIVRHAIAAERLLMAADGKSLVSWGTEAGLVLWETMSGQERARFPGRYTACAFTPDGRFLAGADGGDEHMIRVFDLVTRKEVLQLEGHEAAVNALAFAPDGRTLASGGGDFTVFLWDMAVLDKKRPLPARPLAPKDLETLWEDLAGEDGSKTFLARNALVHGREAAVPFLRERLKNALVRDVERLARNLADLESDQFATRQKATEELEKLGNLAEPALAQLLENKPALEVRRRVERLLEKIEKRGFSPVQLRMLRGIEVLELAGTPESRQALESLAGQKPQTLLTQEAQAAAQRRAGRAQHP
jgi:WD40 repeat protein